MAEMTTKKLYYEDSYMKEFDAKVLACYPDPDRENEADETCWVVLDQTAFFPEGGGQYSDTGYLDQAKVVDVQEKDGVIYHKTEAPFQEGRTVSGRLNWDERFDKMQQHTGEHIMSGLVHARFGYNNVGFHLADTYCTMDFDGPIEPEEMEEIETCANQAVWENIGIRVLYPTKEEAAKMTYRSKIEIEGQIRIVEIPGYDVCACCAPHVEHTGEIGLIKVIDMIHYKGGERVTMLCGARALKKVQELDENVKSISQLLSVREADTALGVAQLQEEETKLKGDMVGLRRQLLTYQAEQIPIEEGVTTVFDADLEKDAPRELMNRLLDRGAKICAVFAGTDADGYRYVIGSKTEDVRPLGKQLNETFNGRGGGKPEMVQGSLTGVEEEIQSVLDLQ